MTSSGKYKLNTSNLYNRNQTDYTTTPQRPRRTATAATPTTRNRNYEEATDGEDEKKLLSLSERIKRLSTSRVLKDSSQLTHNNNEPFTYLRGPPKKPGATTSAGVNSGAYFRPTRIGVVSSTPTTRASSGPIPNGPKGREVIYAQVVVDPEDRKNKQTRNKRTVHRSYNNNSYTTPNSVSGNYLPSSSTRVRPTGIIGSGTTFSSHKKTSNLPTSSRTPVSSNYNMKGKNVTTVLLNSSSDDIPSSLNMDERIGGGFHNDSRYRSSSSPLLASNEADYYPKSAGIVKQHLRNGYGGRSRYENHYQRHSTDYLHRQSDEDDYNDYKFRGKFGRDERSSPLPPPLFSSYGGRGDTDNSDEFYNYQPVNYGGKSASTNFIDSYGYNKSARTNYKIDEEDEYDTHKNSNKLFDNRIRSQTLGRDSSFKTSINRTEDFINRSKTLDNRISSLRERSMMLEEQNRREQGGGHYSDFKLTTSHNNDGDFTNKKNNAQNAKNFNSKTKEKTTGSGNIFSTLLRRNNKKTETAKNITQSKPTQIPSSNSNIAPNNRTAKPGHNSNFFTSFLEKKRNKKQQQQQQHLNTVDVKKGQAQRGGGEQNTYQVRPKII